MSTIRVGIIAGAIAAVACDGGGPAIVDEDNVSHGDCQIVWQNTEWRFGDFRLRHNDPRSCPDSVSPGDFVTAGGRIIETDAPYPNANGRSWKATLGMFNTNNQCQSFGDSLAASIQNFAYADFDFDGDFEWNAGVWTEYEAGTWDINRDCAAFSVAWFDISRTPAIAHVKVDYTVLDQ